MSQQPAIDILFRAIVYKDPEAWNQVDARAAEFDSIRAIRSTTNPGAIDLDLGLGIKSNEYVIPIFEGPRANFISRDTSVQAHLDAGRSRVLLDYSLSFDSNFAEKLRAVLNKEKVQEVEYKIVLNVLRLKTNNNNVQFDIMPFLYENLRLAREDKNNRRPINTLIAFNMLEYLDFHMLIDNQIDQCFKVNKNFLIEFLTKSSEEFLINFYDSQNLIYYEKISLGINALLLRFAKLWQSENRNIKKIFRGLFDYCISEFGYIPKSELHLIWQGTAGKTVDPFFGPITGQAKDMLAKIRGMAWDMAHLQLMQKLATRNVCGSFFVPYFVSLDVRWRNLLRLNPISFVLIDDSRQTTLVGRRNEIDFQRFFQECLSERAQNELSPEKIAIRRAAAAAAKITDIKALVVKEENYWIS